MVTALIVLVLLLWHPYVLCKLLPGRDISVRIRPVEVEVVITRM